MFKRKVVIARESFVYGNKNHRVRVRKGDVFPDNHEAVKGRESLFESTDELIERATAAPGEKRDVRVGGK